MPEFPFDGGGKSLFVFFGLSVVLGGLAAFSAGRALAMTWRPLWLALAYCIPLAAAMRFLHYALFEEQLLSPQAYALDFLVAAGFAALGFKRTRAREMMLRYGWIDAGIDRKEKGGGA